MDTPNVAGIIRRTLDHAISRLTSRTFLAVLTLVQLSLMLFGLDRHGLWVDEVTSLEVVRGSFSEMARFFRMTPEQHPLYYLLLRGWLVFGTSEVALRSLSVLFAVASLPMLYLLTKSLFDEVLARLTALLLCFSPFYLFYAQEARMYTLLVFLALVNSRAFVAFLRSPSTRWAAVYVATGILGVYTHLFFFLLLGAHGCFLIVRDRRLGPDLWRVAACQALVAVTFIPWAVLLLRNPRTHFWKGLQHIVFGVPYTLFRFSVGYSELLANYQWKERIGQLLLDNALLVSLSAIAFGTLAISGIAYLKRAGQHAILVLCCLLVPMGITLLVSLKVNVISERYFIVSFPFYLILLAAGMRWLWTGDRSRRTIAVVITVLYVSIIGRCFYDYFTHPEFGKEQWREIAAHVSAHEQAGDLIIVHGSYAVEAFRYYYRGSHEPRTPRSLTTDDLADRVWLVVAFTQDDRYGKSFERTYRVAMDRLFPRESGIRLLLLLRNPSS